MSKGKPRVGGLVLGKAVGVEASKGRPRVGGLAVGKAVGYQPTGLEPVWDRRMMYISVKLLSTDPTQKKQDFFRMHHPDTFGCSQDLFLATKRPNYNGRKTRETFKNLHTTPKCSIYGIFTYIYHQFKPNVGKCSSPMEHMGHGYDFIWNHEKWSRPSNLLHINGQSNTRTAFSASRRSILASWRLWKSGIQRELMLKLHQNETRSSG